MTSLIAETRVKMRSGCHNVDEKTSNLISVKLDELQTAKRPFSFKLLTPFEKDVSFTTEFLLLTPCISYSKNKWMNLII